MRAMQPPHPWQYCCNQHFHHHHYHLKIQSTNSSRFTPPRGSTGPPWYFPKTKMTRLSTLSVPNQIFVLQGSSDVICTSPIVFDNSIVPKSTYQDALHCFAAMLDESHVPRGTPRRHQVLAVEQYLIEVFGSSLDHANKNKKISAITGATILSSQFGCYGSFLMASCLPNQYMARMATVGCSCCGIDYNHHHHTNYKH